MDSVITLYLVGLGQACGSKGIPTTTFAVVLYEILLTAL